MSTDPSISPIYYAIYVSPEITAENDISYPLIYTDKNDILKVVKKIKKARFKAFKTLEDAKNFTVYGIDPKQPNENITELNSENVFQINLSKNNINVSEQPSQFRGPKSQDLVKLRKGIECGDYEFVKKTIWENPRYLISSGDTPSILQEGSRYNALHVAAKSMNASMCSLILDTISDIEFIRLLYGPTNSNECDMNIVCDAGDCCDNSLFIGQEDRMNVLLDLYLNTPDRGLNETPLHFAAKFGSVECVEVLTSYPQCDKNIKNKFGQSVKDVICTRCKEQNSFIYQQILTHLEDKFYVPVLRSEDNSVQPIVGTPFSPGEQNNISFDFDFVDPVNPQLEIRAFAGPMTKEEALQFRKKWKTPPRRQVPIILDENRRCHSIPSEFFDLNTQRFKDCKTNKLIKYKEENNHNLDKTDSIISQSGAMFSKITEIWSPLVDLDKGLERIGRDLAHESNVKWHEFWPFLNTFIDLSSEQGLKMLENYLKLQMIDMVIKVHPQQEKELSIEKSSISANTSSLITKVDNNEIGNNTDLQDLQRSLTEMIHRFNSSTCSQDYATNPITISDLKKNVDYEEESTHHRLSDFKHHVQYYQHKNDSLSPSSYEKTQKEFDKLTTTTTYINDEKLSNEKLIANIDNNDKNMISSSNIEEEVGNNQTFIEKNDKCDNFKDTFIEKFYHYRDLDENSFNDSLNESIVPTDETPLKKVDCIKNEPALTNSSPLSELCLAFKDNCKIMDRLADNCNAKLNQMIDKMREIKNSSMKFDDKLVDNEQLSENQMLSGGGDNSIVDRLDIDSKISKNHILTADQSKNANKQTNINPSLYLDKALDVFSNRIGSILIKLPKTRPYDVKIIKNYLNSQHYCIENLVDSDINNQDEFDKRNFEINCQISSHLKLEMRHLHSLIASCLKDSQFSACNFQVLHSKIAKNISRIIINYLVNQINNQKPTNDKAKFETSNYNKINRIISKDTTDSTIQNIDRSSFEKISKTIDENKENIKNELIRDLNENSPEFCCNDNLELDKVSNFLNSLNLYIFTLIILQKNFDERKTNHDNNRNDDKNKLGGGNNLKLNYQEYGSCILKNIINFLHLMSMAIKTHENLTGIKNTWNETTASDIIPEILNNISRVNSCEHLNSYKLNEKNKSIDESLSNDYYFYKTTRSKSSSEIFNLLKGDNEYVELSNSGNLKYLEIFDNLQWGNLIDDCLCNFQILIEIKHKRNSSCRKNLSDNFSSDELSLLKYSSFLNNQQNDSLTFKPMSPLSIDTSCYNDKLYLIRDSPESYRHSRHHKKCNDTCTIKHVKRKRKKYGEKYYFNEMRNELDKIEKILNVSQLSPSFYEYSSGDSSDDGLSENGDKTYESDNDEFFTPPSSPKEPERYILKPFRRRDMINNSRTNVSLNNNCDSKIPDDSSDSDVMVDAFNNSDFEIYIEGGTHPTKMDNAVYNAIKAVKINSDEYPNIYKWKHNIELFSEDERKKWPQQKNTNGATLFDQCYNQSICQLKSPIVISSPILKWPVSSPSLEKLASSPYSDNNQLILTPPTKSWMRIIGSNSPKSKINFQKRKLNF